MTTKYFFRSSNGNDLMTGPMMISTSRSFVHARMVAKRKFKEYGYKGRAIHIGNPLAN